MVKELYKKGRIPIVSILFIASCLIVVIFTKANKELFYVFGTSNEPIYIWQFFTGIFEHSIFSPITGKESEYFIFIHFATNLVNICLFGFIIENVFGPKKIFMLNILGTVVAYGVLLISANGRLGMYAGASGVVYSYIPPSLYIIYKKIKRDRCKIYKHVMTYIYAIVLIMDYLIISVLSSWEATGIYHLAATVIGVIFLLKNKKLIDKEEFYQKGKYYNYTFMLVIIPILLIVIAQLYIGGYLGSVYNWWR